MSIEVKQVDDNTLNVAGKTVYKDGNGKWIGANLTQPELDAAQSFIAALEK